MLIKPHESFEIINDDGDIVTLENREYSLDIINSFKTGDFFIKEVKFTIIPKNLMYFYIVSPETSEEVDLLLSIKKEFSQVRPFIFLKSGYLGTVFKGVGEDPWDNLYPILMRHLDIKMRLNGKFKSISEIHLRNLFANFLLDVFREDSIFDVSFVKEFRDKFFITDENDKPIFQSDDWVSIVDIICNGVRGVDCNANEITVLYR